MSCVEIRAKEPHFSLYTSWQLIAAEASFTLAFSCFLAAIMGWRIQLRRRFPRIRVDVDGAGWMATTCEPVPGLVVPVQLHSVMVHFTSMETDRSTSIKTARLFARVKPGGPWPFGEGLFTAPRWEMPPSLNLRPLRFPMNLEPQASEAGDLIFEMRPPFLAELADPFDARIEIEDANTGKLASFPAALGKFHRGHGLRATTRAEWVSGATSHVAPDSWQGLLPPYDDPHPDPAAR